jgi:very-short-patch-repair endonuclease
MSKLIILAIAVGILIFLIEILRSKENEKQKYQYKQKNFFMSRAEHECYDALFIAVGEKYHIFPQVHLPSIIDNKVVGQNWKGAFRHISQKSVDFVLCDKSYISPKLAIELDDRTHERQDRKDRDGEVERILKDAKLPLLRLENYGRFNPNELLKKINIVLDNSERQDK